MQTPDLYQVLGVSRHATPDELKNAYRQKSRELHPDRTGNNPVKTAEFHVVQRAYTTLSHAKTRVAYDRSINQPESIMELFRRPQGRREMEFMLPAGRKEIRMGPNIFQQLSVPEQVLRDGGSVRISTTELKIRAGTVSGSYAVVKGHGQSGVNGGEPGDLIVQFISKQGARK